MELTPARVEKALTDWAGEGGRASVTGTRPGDRLTGYVVHPAFRGVAVADRQSMLWHGDGTVEWKGLSGLFNSEATQIGVIFTYSPEEYAELFGGESDVA